MELIALETRRKLGQVNFRQDFWDCYRGQRKKNWPLADWCQEEITENSPPVPFSFLKW